MPPGSLLGPLEALLEGLWIPKTLKNYCFLRFLKMQIFCSLKLFTALLGSSCPLLGPIWSQNGLQNCPKVVKKVTQKWFNKLPKSYQTKYPKNTKQMKMLDPKMSPKIGKVGDNGPRAQPSGRCLGSSWSQDAPKMPSNSLR